MSSHENTASADEKPLEATQNGLDATADDAALAQDKELSSGQATPKDDAETKKQQEQENIEKQYERPRAKLALIMLSLCLAVFLAALDITVVTTALPTIAADFNSPSSYTWVGSSYLLAVAASTLFWGKLSDVFGRKPTLLAANFLFFVGSLICGLSINIGMLLAGRAIQGAGGGGLVALVNICVSDLFSPRRRGAYFGVIGGVWALASALGPIIGGAFTQRVTWRWCFYINLPFDGLAFIILILFLDIETPKTALVEGLKAIDWLGAFLVITATLLFLFGLEYGGVTFPWDSAKVICLIVFGVFTFVLFVLSQVYFSKSPIMPQRIIMNRSRAASLGVCAIQSFVFIGSNYYLPLYFQAALGATPLLSGVYLLPTAISLSVASIATGIFIRKTGMYKPPILVGMVLMCLGYGLLINLDSTSGWAKIILYQIVVGLGIGPNFQAPLIALQSNINPRDIASGTALFAFTRNLCTAISVVVAGVIFQNEFVSNASSDPQLTAIAGASSGGPGASIGAVRSLPQPARSDAEHVFAISLQPAWIMYTAFSAVGILVWALIGTNTLSKQHQETKTGMEAERERREEFEREKKERAEKRRSKNTSAGGINDLKGSDAV